MHYYEHHLGDWAKDVRGLSMTEEGAYRRLLDAYYSTEQPLPADPRECCDIANARTRLEVDAVRKVLGRFFTFSDDGRHHQKRADVEIGRYQAKQAKARASANARWDAKRAQSEGNANASAGDMRTHSDGNADGMHRARALHTPVTSNQSPIPFAGANGARAGAGEACRAMREAGLAEVNPSNPTLATMLQQGMTVAELADAARAAVAEGKGFAWALKRAAGKREDAARVALAPAAPRGQFMAEILAGAPREDDHDEPDARARG